MIFSKNDVSCATSLWKGFEFLLKRKLGHFNDYKDLNNDSRRQKMKVEEACPH